MCPEVEIGMGTPREPIQLVASLDGVPSMHERVRLVGVASGEDWTERMHEWARDRARELAALDLSGYVFKARSPSCGIDHVVVHAVDGERQGRGLFAQALIDALPDLPVTDEASLVDPAAQGRAFSSASSGITRQGTSHTARSTRHKRTVNVVI